VLRQDRGGRGADEGRRAGTERGKKRGGNQKKHERARKGKLEINWRLREQSPEKFGDERRKGLEGRKGRDGEMKNFAGERVKLAGTILRISSKKEDYHRNQKRNTKPNFATI